MSDTPHRTAPELAFPNSQALLLPGRGLFCACCTVVGHHNRIISGHSTARTTQSLKGTASVFSDSSVSPPIREHLAIACRGRRRAPAALTPERDPSYFMLLTHPEAIMGMLPSSFAVHQTSFPSHPMSPFLHNSNKSSDFVPKDLPWARAIWDPRAYTVSDPPITLPNTASQRMPYHLITSRVSQSLHRSRRTRQAISSCQAALSLSLSIDRSHATLPAPSPKLTSRRLNTPPPPPPARSRSRQGLRCGIAPPPGSMQVSRPR